MSLTIPRIAWRNLWRNWQRTCLALLAIGVGQWALLATQGIMRGYADNIQRTITGPMVGHLQIHHPDYREKRAMDRVLHDVDPLVDRLRALPDVDGVAARIYAPVLVAPERDAFMATVVGLDVAAESRPYGMLSGNAATLEPGKVLIGSGLARRIGAAVGQEIAVLGSATDGSMANDLYVVQAIVTSPVELVNQNGIIMNLADARELMIMPGQAHEIVLRATRLDQVDGIAAALHADPALAGLDIATWREIVPEFVIIIDMVDYVAYFLLALVLVAALAGITNTLMMATYERMHEFGMLLALGCTPPRIRRMILVEAVWLGIVGVAVGTVLGYAFVLITAQTGIDMGAWGGGDAKELAYGGMRLPLEIRPRLTLRDPILGLVAVIIVSMIAALWPAFTASRLEPMEAMRA